MPKSAGEERLDMMLSHISKAQAMNPSEDQLQRMWALVEEGQQRLEELAPMARVRYVEEGVQEITG